MHELNLHKVLHTLGTKTLVSYCEELTNYGKMKVLNQELRELPKIFQGPLLLGLSTDLVL